jgi:hypothetical protein
MTSPTSHSTYAPLIATSPLRDKKNSLRVLHGDFADLAADEARAIILRRDRERHGEPYRQGQTRPAGGAFEIVPETHVAQMLHVLVKHGLVCFENNTPVDICVKKVTMPDGDFLAEVPTSSEILFQSPKREGDNAKVLFRVLLTDPCFVDNDNNPLYQELPQKYIKAVLNNLNPFALFLANGKELPELLKRAGDQAEGFEKMLKFIARQWKDKKAPEDFATMRELVILGMLHEFVHGLALHLPDYIPEGSSQETLRDLESITFDKYLELINADKELQTSVVFYKNLLKALREVMNMEETVEAKSRINEILALEMFCDRFSIFLYENSIKMRIYSDNLEASQIPFPVDIDVLLHLERQRRAGALRLVKGIGNVLSDAEFDRLESELIEAETAHLFISKFGDPKLTIEEIEFFARYLNLIKHFDSEKIILRFSMKHAEKSRFLFASLDGSTRSEDIGSRSRSTGKNPSP